MRLNDLATTIHLRLLAERADAALAEIGVVVKLERRNAVLCDQERWPQLPIRTAQLIDALRAYPEFGSFSE